MYDKTFHLVSDLYNYPNTMTRKEHFFYVSLSMFYDPTSSLRPFLYYITQDHIKSMIKTYYLCNKLFVTFASYIYDNLSFILYTFSKHTKGSFLVLTLVTHDFLCKNM